MSTVLPSSREQMQQITDPCVETQPDVEHTSWRSRTERPVPRSWVVSKRVLDVAIALVALAGSSPILAVAMIFIVLSSPGSPLFAQERVGIYGRRFTILKLRTMRPKAHESLDALRGTSEVSGPVFKMKRDPRVFFVGRLLRKLSIDEIPNLVSVLSGHMSIVGPRPPLPSEVEGYDDYAFRRLRVKPGITCVWQISGRSAIDFDEWMRLDHEYLDNWSPLYDLKIILATFPAVLLGKGAY
jgi:lipopolysaccharide/colanic/teichoic acid biosynthesis glycosyltransferase